jgi:hypothetical protein
MNTPTFVAPEAGVDGLNFSEISGFEVCPFWVLIPSLDFDGEGETVESLPRNTRLSSWDSPENPRSATEAMTSFLLYVLKAER